MRRSGCSLLYTVGVCVCILLCSPAQASVIARKIGREQAAINQVVDGYLETFENVKSIDASGSASRWAVAQSIAKQVKEATKHAREYARALAAGRCVWCARPVVYV